MYRVFTGLQPPFPCVVKQEIEMTLKLKKVSFSSFDMYSPFEK